MSDLKSMLKAINLKEFSYKHYDVDWKGNFAVCCFPGHCEKTPSLSYKEDGNYVSCFGTCQETCVDIFKFVAIMEGIDYNDNKNFPEIMKKICELEGIEYVGYSNTIDPKKMELMQIKTECANKFILELQNRKGGDAYNYLLNRGLTDETIKLFRLGATAVNNEKRYSNFVKWNISNRIAIPILNPKGNLVIATSFRKLEEEQDKKYIHDNTDIVFKKSEVLYGYSHAIDFIKKRNHCYIVEGYFDMISMYQAGMENTVACMTCEMTEEQLMIIKRVTNNITIIIDQDKAGVNGFKKTLQMMLGMGLKVKIVSSLNYLGKDVNDLCCTLNWRKNEIQAVINSNARDGVLYIVSSLLDKYDEKMMEMRANILRAALSYLDPVDDNILKMNYKSYIKKRLGM